MNDAIQVGKRGVDLAPPRLEQREPVPPSRLVAIQADGHFVIRGSLDEQAVGLEGHAQASPTRGIGPIGIHGCRQFIEERRNRGVELAEGRGSAGAGPRSHADDSSNPMMSAARTLSTPSRNCHESG